MSGRGPAPGTVPSPVVLAEFTSEELAVGCRLALAVLWRAVEDARAGSDESDDALGFLLSDQGSSFNFWAGEVLRQDVESTRARLLALI